MGQHIRSHRLRKLKKANEPRLARPPPKNVCRFQQQTIASGWSSPVPDAFYLDSILAGHRRLVAARGGIP
jgi:hypothetical protein